MCKAPIILFNDSDLCININCKINKEHREQNEKNTLNKNKEKVIKKDTKIKEPKTTKKKVVKKKTAQKSSK